MIRIVRWMTCVAMSVLGGPTASFAQSPAEFTGAVAADVISVSGLVQRVMVTVGDGGTGPFKAVLVGDVTLTTLARYRPRDLSGFGASRRLPIVAWANGGCRKTSGEFRNFLSEIASHGFLVVAIGPPGHIVDPAEEEPALEACEGVCSFRRCRTKR